MGSFISRSFVNPAFYVLSHISTGLYCFTTRLPSAFVNIAFDEVLHFIAFFAA